jgi:hypothetical protein
MRWASGGDVPAAQEATDLAIAKRFVADGLGKADIKVGGLQP